MPRACRQYVRLSVSESDDRSVVLDGRQRYGRYSFSPQPSTLPVPHSEIHMLLTVSALIWFLLCSALTPGGVCPCFYCNTTLARISVFVCDRDQIEIIFLQLSLLNV